MSEVQLDRSGLPVRQEAGSRILTPGGFDHDYRAWLRDTGRGSENIPPGTRRFVDWWVSEEGQAVRKPVVPTAMTHGTLIGWWLTWQRETSQERLVPFDLKRFSEWWRAQAIRDCT